MCLLDNTPPLILFLVSGVYGSTPLTHIPPEVPPHGRPLPSSTRRGGGNTGGGNRSGNNTGGGGNSVATTTGRDSYCEQISVVNMSLNQCASSSVPASTKRLTGDNRKDYHHHHPCEHEPLLAPPQQQQQVAAAPSSLAAHVLPPRSSSSSMNHPHYPRQQQHLKLGNNSSMGSHHQMRLHNNAQQIYNGGSGGSKQQQMRSQQQQHGSASSHHHRDQLPQSLPQQLHHHDHHHHSHHHHHQHHSQSQKKWPVSSHFPDWDQREVNSRAGASWKSRSAQARVRQTSESNNHSSSSHRHHQCKADAVDGVNPMGLILPSLPKHYQVEEAGVRNKLRNLTRHYSDDSLHGSSNRELYATRIHSSADEISSVNRSPSISSSDESFSRTDFSRTDADSPSPERAPSLNDVRFKYMFGDMNADGNVVPRFRELSPQLYSDYLSSVKASSDESSLRLNSLTLDSSHHSHPNMAGVWRESDIGPPLTDSDRLRRDDLFIPKLTAEFSSDKIKRTKTEQGSSNKKDSKAIRNSASPAGDKFNLSVRTSLNDEDRISPLRGSTPGSAHRLYSLDRRSPRSATSNESSGGASKRRSLPRDASRKPNILSEQFTNRKTSSMREYDRRECSADRDNKLIGDHSYNKKNMHDCLTEPKRSHQRKTSGDFERSKKFGKSSPFEGITEDQVVGGEDHASERYDDMNASHDSEMSERLCCSSEIPDCCVSHNSYSQLNYNSQKSLVSATSSLEGYSALHKLARLQEDALLNSLEKHPSSSNPMKLGLHFDPQSKRNVLQLSPENSEPRHLLSYEPGKEGSLLR